MLRREYSPAKRPAIGAGTITSMPISGSSHGPRNASAHFFDSPLSIANWRRIGKSNALSCPAPLFDKPVTLAGELHAARQGEDAGRKAPGLLQTPCSKRSYLKSIRWSVERVLTWTLGSSHGPSGSMGVHEGPWMSTRVHGVKLTSPNQLTQSIIEISKTLLNIHILFLWTLVDPDRLSDIK